MCKYEFLVYWSKEDDLYISEVPELSGCVADGKDCLEAVKNAQIVIGEWIESAKITGRSIPEPKGKLAYA